MLDCLVKSNALAYNCFIQALCLTNQRALAELVDPDYAKSLHCRTAVDYEQSRMINIKPRQEAAVAAPSFETNLTTTSATETSTLSSELVRQVHHLLLGQLRAANTSPRNSCLAVLEDDQTVKMAVACTQENVSIHSTTSSSSKVFNVTSGQNLKPMFTIHDESDEFKREESSIRSTQSSQHQPCPIMGTMLSGARARSRSTTPLIHSAAVTPTTSVKFYNNNNANLTNNSQLASSSSSSCFMKQKSGGLTGLSLASQCMTPSSSNHCFYSCEQPSTPVCVSATDDRDALNDITSPSNFYAATGNPEPPSNYDDLSWDDVNQLDNANLVVYKSLPIKWNQVKPNEVIYDYFFLDSSA
jgi:hypothetical protein